MKPFRVITYNTLCLDMHLKKPGERERRGRVVEVINRANSDPEYQDVPTVWTIQELASSEALLRLAKDTDLTCEVGKPQSIDTDVVCDPGGNGFGVGLMWSSQVEAIPGTLRAYSPDLYFHGLVKVHLKVHGITLQGAATHFTPFGGPQIRTEAGRVVSNLTRPDDRPPGFVGSDSNAVTGDRVRRDGRWQLHADDPYAKQPWLPDMIYQCKWRYDEETGRRVHWADRDAGDALWAGGLYETGAILDAPFEPSVGYWPEGDPYGPRDIDHVRVTRELRSAVVSQRVLRSDLALSASDHLPKEVIFDLDRLDPDAEDLDLAAA